MTGSIEIRGGCRTRWCKGPCARGCARIKPCCQATGLGAALHHPGACHSARVAHGPGSGLGPLHHCVSVCHGLPEDDVCDGFAQPALQERGVQGGDQPVHTGGRLHTGSTQGKSTSTQIQLGVTFLSAGWFLSFIPLRLSFSFSTQGSVKLHCQRSPLLYADRQPDLKSDVTGFNEILLEKTLWK